MSTIRANDEESIFAAAIECKSFAERAAFLNAACDGDQLLKSRVEALLCSHEEAGTFLNVPAAPAATLEHIPQEPIGTQIGPYKLRELLGEGGMGSVYVAEQERPVRRKVALKLIKPGMDSRQVLGRFEAERQTLALMDHPNIAKVLEAGTTESGRPYFVMELVRGVAITEFCDQRRLDPRRRLELFVQVCRAIQHAHQKGIIHRDIKPSNILVTMHDDIAVPKVIDFGIAKATCERLTEQTVYTAFSQMIGTPLYMSPEQAEMNALDVDTRSDVYSLGVLLYELLTGNTPFDGDTFRQAGFDEMRRLIREVDPPRPSQRVSTLDAEAASTVSQSRSIDQRRLHRVLRGDVDWIVMKALEKDRNRRYESASALAADVQRHLDGEPIQARPPRLFAGGRKWCRRHRTATTTAVVTAILLSMIATGLAADRRRQVVENNRFVETSLKAAHTALESGDVDQSARRMGEAQARIDATQLVDPALSNEVASLKSESERYIKFIKLYETARNDRRATGVITESAREALTLYGVMENPRWQQVVKEAGFPDAHNDRITEAVYELLLLNADQLTRWSGNWPKATRKARLQAQCREAMTCLEKAIAFHTPSRGYYWLLANCSLYLGDKNKEKRLRAKALETSPHDAADLFYMNRDRWWGTATKYNGYPEYTFEENYKDHRDMLRLEPNYYNALFFMAFRLAEEGRHAEALVGWYGCLAIKPGDTAALVNRGWAHSRLGHFDEAKADYEAEVAAAPNNPRALGDVALNLASDPAEVMRDGNRAVELALKACTLTNYGDAGLIDTLGCAYAEAGDFESAIKWSEMAVQLSDNYLKAEYKKHLERFRQNKAWREE